MLQPGTYNYAFQCNLPIGLPTSVEGDHGYIRYSVILTLDRPLWSDQDFKEQFTVINPLNLNVQPTLRVRILSLNWSRPHTLFNDKFSFFYPLPPIESNRNYNNINCKSVLVSFRSGKSENLLNVLSIFLLSNGADVYCRPSTGQRLYTRRNNSTSPQDC